MKHKQQIIKLYEEGKSYREIQKILGCSKGTISYHLGHGQKDKAIVRQKDKRDKIKAYIQELKQNTPCKDCREYYPYWIMQFDHLRDKEFIIGKFNRYTNDIEKVKKEIEKCDIVCANCHANRTYNRQVMSESNTLDITKYYT